MNRILIVIFLFCSSFLSAQWKTDCVVKKIYTWETTPGVVEKIWDTPSGDAVTHTNASNIFTEISGPCLAPTHPNDPTVQNIEPDWNANTADNPNNGTDQYSYEGWIYIDQDSTCLQDINSNTGEQFLITIDGVLVYERFTNTSSPDRGSSNTYFVCGVSKGWHFLGVYGSDFSAFGGIQLQDSSSVATWANFDGLTSTTAPKLICRDEGCGYVLQIGEYDCPQSINASCTFNGFAGGGDPTDELQLLSTTEVGGATTELTLSDGNTVPINHPAQTPHVLPQTSAATLESDNNITEGTFSRTGNVGTSLLYAREDHQHPIVRIPNPGDPVVTLTGTATLNAQIILDRESTEEWYAYKMRVHITNMTAGNNWVFVTIPTIAGFQQPMITGIGNYRNSTSQLQDDDNSGAGGEGASPRGPYMGKEWHEWSSTRRLYFGYFRRDNDLPSNYLEFWVKYIRL